jgi:hypothetical protein
MRPSTHRYLAFTKPLFGLFWGVTMRFFKGIETLGWNIQNSDVQLFVILETWKTIPAISLNPPIQANFFHVNHCSKFGVLEKVFLQRVMRLSDKGTLTFIEIQLGIMAAWNKVSLIVLRTSAQSYVAKCECINRIFCPKNPIHCTSWNLSLKVYGLCESNLRNSVD